MKYQVGRLLSLGVAVAVGYLGGGAPAHAQKALEEIIVTAQRKAENLQDVPISISAFSANMLEQTGIDGPGDLSLVTPSLALHRGVSGTSMFLRGVGSISAYLPGFENSIATYIDGVYIDNSMGNIFSFNNIERVEVLKGPQGTLYGRNATGGLVHVITKTPEQEFGGQVELSYGDYDTAGGKLYVTGGLSDNVAADLAVYYTDQGEGFGDNLGTGKEILWLEELSIRAGLLWNIGENTTARLNANYSDVTNDFGIARTHPDDGGFHFGGYPYTGNYYNLNTNHDNLLENESMGASLTIKHNWDDFELTSITAYREAEADMFLDQELTPVPLIDMNGGVGSDFLSQEIRLLSSGDSDLEWIAGLYFMKSMGEFSPFTLTGAGLPFQAFTGHSTQDTESYSAFFEATYHISDATSLTGGLRWTRDDRELSEWAFFNFLPQTRTPTIKDDESWEEPTWRLSLDHSVNDGTLLFASYSRGYKSGVYATSTALGDVLTGVVSDPVEPETLDAYEMGFKSDLADGSLRVNGSLYFYDYTNLQFDRVTAGIAILWNAGEAEIWGGELEFNWLATDNLELRGGISVVDAEYTEFNDAPLWQPNPNPPYGNIQVLGDGSGNTLVRTADYTYNLGAVYTVETGMGSFAAAMLYAYNDGFPWEVDNRLAQDSYDVVNAELSLTSSDESWRVRVYGKNLFDEEYALYGVSSSFGDSYGAAPPRTWGVALSYDF